MQKSVIGIFVSILCIIPSIVLAQSQCSEDDQDSLDICIEDATFECLDAFPECEGGSADESAASDLIVEYTTESCCNKGSSGKIVACFNSALASLKKGGKILPPEVRSAVKSDLKDFLSEVRDLGECPSDDDEDEEDDDDDDF